MSGYIADIAVAESDLVRPMGASACTVSLDSFEPRTVEIGDGSRPQGTQVCENALYAV